jgi:hypothetical protein
VTGMSMSAKSIGGFFYRLFEKLDLIGDAPHSGRREFVTMSAKEVAQIGGSLRDVQQVSMCEAGWCNLRADLFRLFDR